MASDEAVQGMFGVLVEVWPRDGERISPATMQIYSRVLADIPDDVLRAAVVKVVSEATFWPKPAELRRAALDMIAPNGLSASEAWGMVKGYIRRVAELPELRNGEWLDKPQLPERVQRALACLGGISYLRNARPGDEMSDRHQFMKAYEGFAQREREQALMLPEVRAVMQRIAGERAMLAAGE